MKKRKRDEPVEEELPAEDVLVRKDIGEEVEFLKDHRAILND